MKRSEITSEEQLKTTDENNLKKFVDLMDELGEANGENKILENILWNVQEQLKLAGKRTEQILKEMTDLARVMSNVPNEFRKRNEVVFDRVDCVNNDPYKN